MQLLVKFKKILYMGWNLMCRIFLTWPKVASYTAYLDSIVKKKFTIPFLKYKRLKLKLRVILPGHTVAMVTYSVMKMTFTTC